MNIKLHKNARTTPAVRAEIAASNERACVLASRYGVTEATIYKWKKRESFTDKSHTAHRLQTTLNPSHYTQLIAAHGQSARPRQTPRYRAAPATVSWLPAHHRPFCTKSRPVSQSAAPRR